MPHIIRWLALLPLSFLAACSTSTNDDSVTGALGFEVLDPRTHFPVGWEQGTGGFTTYPAGAPWQPDSVMKRSGHYSLALHAPTDADGSSIAHIENKRVKASIVMLTAYMRTEDVQGEAKLWLTVEGDNGRAPFPQEVNSAATGTTGWTMYHATTRVIDGERISRIRAGAMLMGRGKVWLDDVRIMVDGTDIAAVPEERLTLLPADRDTTFLRASGIPFIALTPQRVETLAKLGQVWAFIKYHHPAVQRGEHNMDAALFRVLPAVLREETAVGADAVMEHWVDGFGIPLHCATCTDVADTDSSVHVRPDYGRLFDEKTFPRSLVAKLRTFLAGRLPGDSDHYYIGLVKAVGNPVFRHERPYREHIYPDAGLRLLALYRYWAMIQYFFPNRHLIGEDWTAVLANSLPDFIAAPDALAYQTAVQKTIMRIHDSHASVPGNAVLARARGALVLPVTLRFAGEDLVVTGYHGDTVSALIPGDVVRAIDGVPVPELMARARPLVPASNPATERREVSLPYSFLSRSDAPDARLTILREGGVREIVVRRIPYGGKVASTRRPAEPYLQRGWGILPGNLGYIFPEALPEDSAAKITAALHATRGLIIDFRCYPSARLDSYYAWLHARPATFTRITAGSTGLPGLFRKKDSVATGARGAAAYRGKVIILVNEETQSAAEFARMAFQTVPGAVTIGSTTAGADGNVSTIILPGGLGTRISGLGILYPDGTETQRAGVRIDKVVNPTAAGIRAGKDEVLEAALDIIARKTRRLPPV